MNHLSAIIIGVVRQDVNMSAGNTGFIGSSSPTSHAARTQFVWLTGSDDGDFCCPPAPSNTGGAVKNGSRMPAELQSRTYIEGLPVQDLISYTVKGMYCV